MLTSVLNRFGMVGLKVQKYIPEICMGAGAAMTVIGSIECCKATLKVEPIIDDAKKEIYYIHEEAEEGQDIRRDLTRAYGRACFKTFKAYSKGIAIFGLGMASMFYGYGVLDGRYVGAMGAASAWESRFNKLEEGVINKYGKDVRDELLYGITREDIEMEVVDEEGEVKTKKYKKAKVYDESDLSEFAVFFGPGNPNWEKNPAYNLMWLRGIENYCADLLKSRKHLFVNDVLDALGEKRTAKGAIEGWLYNDGDNSFSFGIDWEDGEKRPSVRRFLNGMESSVWLDLRPAGRIWNMI